MSRVVMDSISYAALSGKHWPHLIGYVNGRVSAWSGHDIAAARAKDQLLGLVDVLGTAPRQASILDFERGDVQSPAVVNRWVEARDQVANDAVVYVQPPKIPTIVKAVGRMRTRLWVVDLTADGELAFDIPDYGPLPHNVTILARQCVFGPRSGGNFDLSVFYDDTWHPEQQHPAHYSLMRAAAAAELGPYAAAVLPDVDTAAAAAIAAGSSFPTGAVGKLEVDPAAEHRAAEQTAAARQLGIPAPEEQAGAAVDQAAADLAGAVLVASTAPSSPTSAGSTSPAAGPADPAGSVATAAAGDSAMGPAQSPLNHDFIRSVLGDVGTVANMLHQAGWPNVAAELRRGAGLAWEVGGMMKALGL